MKKFPLLLALVLVAAMLAGCAGTPVVYNCTCPTAGETAPAAPETTQPALPAPEGALKTGLALVTSVSDSTSATADAAGQAKYDVTMVAVLVDEAGVIQDCIIDGVATSVGFDAAGAITTDIAAPVSTKNELGEAYGMKAYGGAVAEWDQQAQALADFAVGKTVQELKEGAIDESGKAPAGSDLATSATIYLGGYVSAIEVAAANAQHLGAQAGDTLHMAASTQLNSSAPAAADQAGNAQLDTTVAVLTLNGETITSCTIDSVQAKVAFDNKGAITSDISAPVATKNQLGEDYGMKAWGGAIAEWDQQTAAFCAYVTGKTAQDVTGIAVDAATKPTEADLATSVTISIGGFQALVEKAAQN